MTTAHFTYPSCRKPSSANCYRNSACSNMTAELYKAYNTSGNQSVSHTDKATVRDSPLSNRKCHTRDRVARFEAGQRSSLLVPTLPLRQPLLPTGPDGSTTNHGVKLLLQEIFQTPHCVRSQVIIRSASLTLYQIMPVESMLRAAARTKALVGTS